MAVRVLMPTFGLTEGEATIVRWRKRVGEQVKADEPLFEAESEKASLEVPAPQSGVLLSVLVAEGEIASYGNEVAWIGEATEQTQMAGHEVAPSAPTAMVERSERASGIDATSSEPRLKASPIARNMARSHNIDLSSLRGSGPGGRIVEADVRRAIQAQEAASKEASSTIQAASHAAIQTTGPLTPATSNNGELLPLSSLRRTTAERLSASAHNSVAVPLFLSVDMSEIVRLREQTRAEYEKRFGAACSYNALILRACALTLPEYPELNGQWTEAGVRAHGDVNIGLAVALEDGLLVPVIHQAQQKRLTEIQAQLQSLVAAARTRTLSPQNLSNGTFTVTNLGHVGIEAFVPIINLPQTAILGVGSIADQVVVRDGQPAIRPMMTLCLVFDHRACDGAPAAACLARIKALLENPYLLA